MSAGSIIKPRLRETSRVTISRSHTAQDTGHLMKVMFTLTLGRNYYGISPRQSRHAVTDFQTKSVLCDNILISGLKPSSPFIASKYLCILH